jgi:uncharacterized protein (DUF433 family)
VEGIRLVGRVENIQEFLYVYLCESTIARVIQYPQVDGMLKIESQPVPLTTNEQGVLRITGTRVSLDSVIAAFDVGATPEQIVYKFPTLKLEDVYAVIAYYLRHQAEVQSYLTEQRKEAEALLTEIEAEFSPPQNLRERLLKRRHTQGTA